MTPTHTTWNSKFLIVLWVIQVPIASYDTLIGLLRTCAILFGKRYYSTVIRLIMRPVADATMLVLVSFEVNQFRSGHLRPLFLGTSQSLRAIVQSYGLFAATRGYIKYLYSTKAHTYLVCSFLMTFSLYLGSIYGTIVWLRQRRRKGSQPGCDTNRAESLMTPESINQAQYLSYSFSQVTAVVHWVYAPLVVDNGRFPLLATILNTTAFVIRYMLGVVVLAAVIPFSPRLASEPKQTYNTENHEFTDWNYVTPKAIPDTVYKDEIPTLLDSSSDAGLSEASRFSPRAAETLTMHTIDQDEAGQHAIGEPEVTTISGMTHRLLGPRFLCYLDDSQPQGYRTMSTNDWPLSHDSNSIVDYVFVSYTRRQFYTQISGDPALPAERNIQLQKAADRDTKTLIDIAISAARTANVNAFWIDYECVQPEGGDGPEDSMEDVYRICDVVRAAHSMAIVTGPALRPDYEHDESATSSQRTRWLHEWGKRLWTVPEAILCPTEHRIAVYAVGYSSPEYVAKRNLASRVWDDAGTLHQLVDHFGSEPLPPLEVISIALECLQRRQTEKRTNGDVAYALMGLLRYRPRVVKTDSSFQAFARLSLANNSDMLLERLISLRAPSHDVLWHDMRDIWDARLWTIDPLIQVSGIGDKDAITLGGAQGALINWSFLHAVDYTAVAIRPRAWHYARSGPTTLFSFLATTLLAHVLINAVADTFLGQLKRDPLRDVSWIWDVIFLCLSTAGFFFALPSLFLLRTLQNREIRKSQARLFGIEGVPSLKAVENCIFGHDTGRIQWVSPRDLTRSREPHARRMSAITGQGLRQFTLVDTLTLSAMTFEARRPPNVAVASGKEHGFARVLLCSYEPESNSFYKETVLRMSTAVLDHMSKMDRFQLTLGTHRAQSC